MSPRFMQIAGTILGAILTAAVEAAAKRALRKFRAPTITAVRPTIVVNRNGRFSLRRAHLRVVN